MTTIKTSIVNVQAAIELFPDLSSPVLPRLATLLEYLHKCALTGISYDRLPSLTRKELDLITILRKEDTDQELYIMAFNKRKEKTIDLVQRCIDIQLQCENSDIDIRNVLQIVLGSLKYDITIDETALDRIEAMCQAIVDDAMQLEDNNNYQNDISSENLPSRLLSSFRNYFTYSTKD